MRSIRWMRTAKTSYITLSAALCAIGAVLMLRPELPAQALGKVLGTAMIAFGTAKLLGYFSRDLYRLAFQFDLAFGLLLIALGALLIARPALAAGALNALVGVEIAADALLKLQTALDARQFGLKTWSLLLALSLLSAAVGVALAFHPQTGASAAYALLGGAVLSQGILNLAAGVCAVKIIRRANAARPNG